MVIEEMNKEYVISSIEKILNNEEATIDEVEALIQKNSVDKALENVAYRLIKYFKRFRLGLCGEADYLVALRGFMLSYQTSLRTNIGCSVDSLEKYGIYYEPTSKEYYAVYSVPEFLPQKSFVEGVFVNAGTSLNETKSSYCLMTNRFIENLTGFRFFKSLEQKLCVYGALNAPLGYTTLVSMPTGGGKSLITQVLGYSKKGLSIVVVPTVSLAIDQERVAKSNVVNAGQNEIFCYYSGINNFSQIRKAIEGREARLLFISPEALIKNEAFRKIIEEANEARYLQNIIVDEAHIVVAWGDFFRVDYQCLSPWRNKLLRANPELRTFLLSATYRDDTVDALKQLFVSGEEWLEIRCDSLRKEPRFSYISAKGYRDKQNKVVNLVQLLPHPMILYVNAPYEALKWKTYLESKGFMNVKTFTGETKSDERRLLIDDWVNNEYDLMIATSAFGVGVDKPDVRTVIHLYMPESSDTYYQELGRGGRDGLPSLSVMCIDEDDIANAYNHVGKVLTTDKFWGRWWSMYRNPNNQWQSGSIAIMASTKPNYNKINYFEEGNDTDEKWNINVLLLLNRKKQIQIVDLDLDGDNRYIFTVRILNDLITKETDAAKALFERLRNEEAIKSQKAFSIIKNSVDKADRLCWSEMFYETYPLVSECCPGCNCHNHIVTSEQNRFPLVVNVRGPEKELSEEMLRFFAGTNEACVMTGESISVLVERYKPNIVVASSFDEDIETDISDLNFMNYQEFNALHVHDDGFYISGLVMAVYDEDPLVAKDEYQTIYKYIAPNRYVIHVTKNDFCVSISTGKKLTELVDGTVLR